MSKQANPDFSFRLVAEARSNGEIRTLARSKNLVNLANRLQRDGDFWDEMGWEGILLEDNSLGFYTETSPEHLRGMMKRGELSYSIYQELRHHCI